MQILGAFAASFALHVGQRKHMFQDFKKLVLNKTARSQNERIAAAREGV